MSTALKRKLSESTDGKPIAVTATSSTGTLIHTAAAGTTPGSYDEVWLWAVNLQTHNLQLTVQFGSTDTKDNIVVTIPFKSGLVPIVPGLPLQNGATINAFADEASMISILGFINLITD